MKTALITKGMTKMKIALITAALLSSFVAAPVFAQGAYVADNLGSVGASTKTRAEVRAELEVAQKNGLVAAGDDYNYPQNIAAVQARLNPQPAKTRAQVREELAVAQKNGLVAAAGDYENYPANIAAIQAKLDPQPVKSRAEVRAELADAVRAGYPINADNQTYPAPELAFANRQQSNGNAFAAASQRQTASVRNSSSQYTE